MARKKRFWCLWVMETLLKPKQGKTFFVTKNQSVCCSFVNLLHLIVFLLQQLFTGCHSLPESCQTFPFFFVWYLLRSFISFLFSTIQTSLSFVQHENKELGLQQSFHRTDSHTIMILPSPSRRLAEPLCFFFWNFQYRIVSEGQVLRQTQDDHTANHWRGIAENIDQRFSDNHGAQGDSTHWTTLLRICFLLLAVKFLFFMMFSGEIIPPVAETSPCLCQNGGTYHVLSGKQLNRTLNNLLFRGWGPQCCLHVAWGSVYHAVQRLSGMGGGGFIKGVYSVTSHPNGWSAINSLINYFDLSSSSHHLSPLLRSFLLCTAIWNERCPSWIICSFVAENSKHWTLPPEMTSLKSNWGTNNDKPFMYKLITDLGNQRRSHLIVSANLDLVLPPGTTFRQEIQWRILVSGRWNCGNRRRN